MSSASANSSRKTSNGEVELNIPYRFTGAYLGVTRDEKRINERGDNVDESLEPEITISSVGTFERQYDKNGNIIARVDKENGKIYAKDSKGKIRVRRIHQEQTR